MPLALLFAFAELIRARKPSIARESVTAGLPVSNGRFAERTTLFGLDIPDQNFRDAKSVFPEFFRHAELAELAVVGVGETVVVAQFPSAAKAKEASALLWKTFQPKNTSGDERNGWRGYRPASQDYIEMLLSGRLLFLWMAPSKDACAARRAATRSVTGREEIQAPTVEPLIASLQPIGVFMRPWHLRITGIALALAFYVVWFFKGAAWAASTPPTPGTLTPATAADLTARIEAINALDVPFHIERGSRPGELLATWRYADARWVDHARAHRMARTFRIRVVLDESARVVRATDYAATVDAAAGADGLRLEWRAVTGIIFFQFEKGTVLGLQMDSQGRLSPQASYTYRFNLNELKSPLIEAVTHAGWTWRPTLWQGPTWLRWLTE